MTPREVGSLPVDAQKLAVFLGEWKTEGSMIAGKDRSAVSGNWTFVEAVGGFGVRGIMQTEIEGVGAFEEIELIGFDPVDSKVHLFSMNKFTIRDHVGGWKGESLVTLYEGGDSGRRVTEEITVEVIAPSRMLGHVTERVDDEIVLTT